MRVLRNSYVSLLAWGILLAGTSSLTSCAEDEVINNYGNKEDGAGISFSLSKDNNVWEADSRATQPKQNFVLRSEDSADTLCVSAQTEYGISDALQADSRGALVTNKDNVLSFGVTSYFYTSTEEADPAFYFMKNEEVVDGKTTKNKVYYWPPSNNELSFVAVAPYHALTLPDSPETSATLSYTVPADVADHEDLMVAKTDRINNGATGTAVGLSFNHILTAVQFAIGEIPAGTITSISVSGNMIQGGTYTINTGEWTAKNTAAAATYTISEATAGAGVVTETIDSKKIVSEKIITMPQNIAENTLTLTVVFNDLSAGERTLRASIPATTWAQGTTTTYTISISPAYDLQFTTTQASIPVKDCHYDIQQLKINTGGVYTGKWAITSDKTWATIRVLPTRDEKNLDLYYQGYWCIDDRGNTTLTGESITTNGIDLLVYLYENTEDTNYDTREVTITLNAINDKNEYIPIATRKIKQYEPLWNGGKAYERIEEYDSETVFPWGFNWSNTEVTFTGSGGLEGLLRTVLFKIFQVFGYGNNITMTWDNTASIDMTNIEALGTTASNVNNGLQNTIDLLSFDGIEDLNASISLLEGWGMTLDEESIETQPTNYAVRMILYKNKFNKETQTSLGNTVNVAVLTSDGVEWYLPAPGEVSTLASTAADNISTNNDTPLYTSNIGYWSSQAVANSNTNSFYYTSSGSVDTSASRTLQKRVRAARIKPTE